VVHPPLMPLSVLRSSTFSTKGAARTSSNPKHFFKTEGQVAPRSALPVYI